MKLVFHILNTMNLDSNYLLKKHETVLSICRYFPLVANNDSHQLQFNLKEESSIVK